MKTPKEAAEAASELENCLTGSSSQTCLFLVDRIREE